MESEAFKNKLKKFTLKVESKSRKASSKARQGTEDTKRVVKIVDRSAKHFTQLVDGIYDDIIKMNDDHRKKKILQGGLRRKLFKLIRSTIVGVAAGLLVGNAVGVAVGAITFLVARTIDNKLDIEAHKELRHDLEVELRLTQEKIRDASNKGDNKAKYQLMRLEDALKKDIERLGTKASNTNKVEGKAKSTKYMTRR